MITKFIYTSSVMRLCTKASTNALTNHLEVKIWESRTWANFVHFTVKYSTRTEQQLCNCDVVDLVANWKLGRDKTKLSPHHISRLDKTAKNETPTVSKFLVDDSIDVANSVSITNTDKTWHSCIVAVNSVNYR